MQNLNQMFTVQDADIKYWYYGWSSDLAIESDGANVTFTGANGNVLIDNTNGTGAIINQLGTDTDATNFSS